MEWMRWSAGHCSNSYPVRFASGVSARLAKLSLAEAFYHKLEEIEELWHGLAAPYLELFLWLENRGGRPSIADVPTFKPLMLSNPLEEKDWDALDLSEMAVETLP